jgi:hypothetical protein
MSKAAKEFFPLKASEEISKEILDYLIW